MHLKTILNSLFTGSMTLHKSLDDFHQDVTYPGMHVKKGTHLESHMVSALFRR